MMTLHCCLIAIYWICSILDISSIYQKGRRIWKPVLMPLLIAVLLTGCGAVQVRIPWLAVVALICGFLGDTLLLNDRLFTYGLGAFLLGHLFYIAEYVRGIDAIRLPLPAMLLIAACILLYGILVCRRLLPLTHGGLNIAVVIYMLAILAMCFTSFLRFGTVSAPSFWSVSVGAGLFVISDTILAFHLFDGTTEHGVMETYCAAQFLIAEGILLGLM